MTDDILDRLREACAGHPYVQIPWPHRLLHDAICEIEALRARRDDLLRSNIAFEERARKAERATKRHEKAIATLTMQYLDLLADGQPPLIARPLEEYHEDMGDVLWWKFPITEPPYVGTPNDLGFDVCTDTSMHGPDGNQIASSVVRGRVGGWPGYHTHFTPIPVPNAPENANEQD